MLKLTAVLMLLGCLQLSARSYGQQITISKKNAPLQELFLDIYKQSGYYFYCNDNLFANAKKVDIQVKNASLSEVLDICFRDQPLTYTITDHVIVVKARVESRAPKSGQAIDVHGRVVDENGEPVEGVTVFVKGTKTGVSTDANGEFNLGTIDKDAILVFTSANMETREVSVKDQGNLLVNLKTKIAGLQDLVVNKGYYSTSQKMNTGSVSIVKAADIERQPVSNPLEAIEGRMAGVYVQQTSGVSGSGFNIEIRGRNSLRTGQTNNGNLPFYIIDGVPTTSASLDALTGIGGNIIPLVSPLNSINPADIESIEILKDADATAIYGSRGANGVVLITTKKGKAGKTRVDLNMYSGAGAITRKLKLLDNPQYLQMRHEAFKNDGQNPSSSAWDLNGTWDTTRFTDWQKTLIGGTAQITNVQMNVSGGNSNTQFLFGGGYFRQSTVFPGSFADQKISSHLNLNHISENKKFSSSLSISYTVDFNNLPAQDPTHIAVNLAPVAPPVYNPDGTLNWANSTWPNYNPFSSFLQPYKGNTNNLVSNGNFSYELFPGFQIKTSLGYTNIQMRQTNLTPISSQNPSFDPVGYGSYSNNTFNSWIIEPLAEYQKAIGKGKMDVLVGGTLQQNIATAESFFANGFNSDALLENLQSASSIYAIVNNYAQYRYDAVFGRINYNWEDKYLINLTGRRDGSSRFGPDKRMANFGAVGIGWIFSKESLFEKGLPLLSFGKLRSSYGITGSDQIGDYGYLDTYSSVASPYNGTSGLTISRLFNPDYAWESNKKFEAALELGFRKDRYLLSVSYYQNRSSNQLVGYPLPSITGQTSLPFFNLPATVQNTGWEFELHTVNTDRNHFKWTTSINFTLPANKLLSYPNIKASSYARTYEVGKSLYIRKSFRYTGVDPQTGLFTFEDVDKNGSISSPNDLQAIKTIAQKFYGGIQNNIIFRHWQLGIFFQFVKQSGLTYLFSFPSPGTLNNQPTVVLNRWQKAGDITNIQKYSQSGLAQSAYGSAQSRGDNRIDDASFIRLKNISLSYELSESWLAKAKIKSFRVFVQGQNLITITKYLGLDPETQSFQALPPLKMLTGGFQIIL